MICPVATVNVYADEETEEETEEEEEETEDSHIVNNFLYADAPKWPTAPEISSVGAVLMDADSGVILYGKNMDIPQYPASITKIMTCLLAAERCSLDEMVTFSQEAVFGIDRGSSNVGMDVGQSITMEEAIYCIMLASANEVAAAVAEHISGTTEEFTVLMNERAKELGCTNTNFVNANGLPEERHHTSPHDMALIARAFDQNDILRRIASTNQYQMEATPTQPDSFPMPNHHQMYPGREYEYEDITWGKTGYTMAAKATLVTCAERNGLDLICVVMRTDPPGQYKDTRALLEYGFSNFHRIAIADYETSYSMGSADPTGISQPAFDNTQSILSVDPKDHLILPDSLSFSDLDSELAFTDEDPNKIAEVTYSYVGHYIGKAGILLADNRDQGFIFGKAVTAEPEEKHKSFFADNDSVVFVNIKMILKIVGIVTAALLLISGIIYILKNYNFPGKRRRDIKRKNRRYHSEFDKFDF